MRKIALPVIDDSLSSDFRSFPYFKLFYEKNGKIIKEELIPAPPNQYGIYPYLLAKMEVTDIIANNIGLRAIKTFMKHKINVFCGVQIKDVKEVIKEFINGTLETNEINDYIN